MKNIAVIGAGIHCQALTMWGKGVPTVPRMTRDGVGERTAWDAGAAGRADSLMER